MAARRSRAGRSVARGVWARPLARVSAAWAMASPEPASSLSRSWRSRKAIPGGPVWLPRRWLGACPPDGTPGAALKAMTMSGGRRFGGAGLWRCLGAAHLSCLAWCSAASPRAVRSSVVRGCADRARSGRSLCRHSDRTGCGIPKVEAIVRGTRGCRAKHLYGRGDIAWCHEEEAGLTPRATGRLIPNFWGRVRSQLIHASVALT